VNIGNFDLTSGRTLIIAELSANHNGSFDNAIATVRAAKRVGADAIKLQTYTADTMTIDCDKEDFQIKSGTLWDGMNLYRLYQQAYTPWEWHAALFEAAAEEGILCFSSPFDKSAVDFLEQLDPPAYKIASFEITDIPLIEYAASKGRPMIISTGIATEEEIHEAVQACRLQGNNDIVLLKCTSAYPAPLEEANLRTIPDLAARFDVISGFSDHTLGIVAPVAAVSLGAKVIEKHFILDRSIGGPDADFSLDELQFAQMVQAVRDTEKMLGAIDYFLSERVKKNRQFSRSLYVVENIEAGEKLTEKNVRSIRPGYGMHPKYLKQLIGKKAAVSLTRGTPLHWEMIEE